MNILIYHTNNMIGVEKDKFRERLDLLEQERRYLADRQDVPTGLYREIATKFPDTFWGKIAAEIVERRKEE
jgi:hypothetical protein